MQRRTFMHSLAALSLPFPSFTDPLRKQIKITGLETDLLRFPPGRPYADAIHNFGPDRGGVALRIRTDAGITGWGYSSFGMIAGAPRVLQTILEHEVKPTLIGQDPAFPK